MVASHAVLFAYENEFVRGWKPKYNGGYLLSVPRHFPPRSAIIMDRGEHRLGSTVAPERERMNSYAIIASEY